MTTASDTYLNKIDQGIVDAIHTIHASSGYVYTVTSGNSQTQEEDFSKANFPLYNVYFIDEESTDPENFPNMRAFRNTAHYEIHCYEKLSTEGSNSIFEINKVLAALDHDIKKMIGSHPTLDGQVESIDYIRSERLDSGQAEDILLPRYLKVYIDVDYSQDRVTPTNVASC